MSNCYYIVKISRKKRRVRFFSSFIAIVTQSEIISFIATIQLFMNGLIEDFVHIHMKSKEKQKQKKTNKRKTWDRKKDRLFTYQQTEKESLYINQRPNIQNKTNDLISKCENTCVHVIYMCSVMYILESCKSHLF